MGNKKKIAVIASIAAVLFIAPLIAFTAMYHSKSKENQFSPAEANVQIEEKGHSDDTQTQTYTFPDTTDANGNYSVEKSAAISEEENPNGEYLRARFVPMWYKDGAVCAGVNGNIADFKTIVIDSSDENAEKLLFRNSSGIPLITLYLTENWSDNWTYKGDGIFESKVPISSGNSKKELLKKVELSPDVYQKAKAAGLELHVDVLADAIQTVDGESSAPRWDDQT
ncbi:MAG: hypothetical protein IJK31_10400 [Ruminococcus sp.]|nr:hypothetical protein [Ruminococcus sp.]